MSHGPLPAIAPAEERAGILRHEPVAPDHYLLRLHAPEIAASAKPGMFLQVRVTDGLDPFLRRPMSIGMARPESGEVDVVYRAGGAGTRALSPVGRPASGCRSSDRSAIRSGSPAQASSSSSAEASVCRRSTSSPTAWTRRACTSCRGARTADLVLFQEGFRALGVKMTCATEDGSLGMRGLVTAALGAALEEETGEVSILSCGPTPMMKAVASMAFRRDIPCQVSLEERMACGFGICMGCAVERVAGEADAGGYGLVCVDGPVFDAREVFGPS